jgi:hypothetical protein
LLLTWPYSSVHDHLWLFTESLLTALEKGKASRSRVLYSRICVLSPFQTRVVAAYSDSYSLRTPVHQFQINSLVHHTKFQRSLAFIHACLWPTRTATSLRAAKHRPNTAYLQSVWSIDSRIVSPSNRISAIPPWLSTLIDLEPAYLTARLVATYSSSVSCSRGAAN